MLNIYNSDMQTPIAAEIKSLWNQYQANHEEEKFFVTLETLDLSFVIDTARNTFWNSVKCGDKSEKTVRLFAEAVRFWERSKDMTTQELIDSIAP